MGAALHPRRGLLLAAGGALLLAGCGFQLRQAPNFAFDSIQVAAAPSSPVGNELRRTIGASGRVQVTGPAEPDKAQVILDLLAEQREKVVVGLNATGQVREFQLRSRIRFKVRNRTGRELIPETELLLQRDISFNESAALSKEAEESLLYRDMQGDLVQQLLRRLAAIKSI
jgi:LPS-assembly lipoprotein